MFRLSWRCTGQALAKLTLHTRSQEFICGLQVSLPRGAAGNQRRLPLVQGEIAVAPSDGLRKDRNLGFRLVILKPANIRSPVL